jgi:pSer/pThr/pTyr-binding forkhead associated (FHA) protein
VELRYADETKGGATQYVNAGEMAALAGLRRAGAARATIASGGRVLSLVDGKEYAVPSAGLSFGRDATCGVVVAQNEVSRRHAEIAPDDEGYVVRDTSANGVFVNGDRVQGSQRLARADVVRVGSEEFRFYADLPAAAPAPTLAAAPAAALPAPAVASAAIPDAAPSGESSLPVLASLEALNEGPAKGTRHLLHAAFVHVGRGAHNEVHLADDSVSETHAKLQRRQDGWYVTDLASTNGTYVDGKRILGDRRLDGAPDVRFGGIKMRFTEAGFDAAAGREGRKGTRAIASAERRPGRAPSSAAAARPGADAERTTRWVWIIGAIAVGTAAFFLFKGRA